MTGKPDLIPATLGSLLLDDDGVTFRQMLNDLMSVSKYVEQGRAQFAQEAGVTPSQYGMLMIIAQHPGIALGQVADKLHLHVPFVVLNLKQLEATGLILREQSPSDRRSSLFSLSTEGIALVERIAPLVRAGNDLWFGGLSRDEIVRMADVFARLYRSAAPALKAVELIRSQGTLDLAHVRNSARYEDATAAKPARRPRARVRRATP